MAPEQILGEGVDARSDLFSLGVVLYQLLCGARPFERGDEADQRPAAHRIRRDPPIPLHRRAPDVPARARADRDARDREAPRRSLPDRGGAWPSRSRSSRRLARASAVRRAAGPRARGRGPRPRSRRRGQRGRPEAQAGLGAPRDRRARACSAPPALVGGVAAPDDGAPRGEAAGLEAAGLLPPSPGYLRVLATPWAEVWVDGQRVDVTPFARAIPLPGGHPLRHARPPERAGREADRRDRRRRDADDRRGHGRARAGPPKTPRPNRRAPTRPAAERRTTDEAPLALDARSRRRGGLALRPGDARAFTHIVKPGETLAQIAERLYGESRLEVVLVGRQRARRRRAAPSSRPECASRCPRRDTTRSCRARPGRTSSLAWLGTGDVARAELLAAHEQGRALGASRRRAGDRDPGDRHVHRRGRRDDQQRRGALLGGRRTAAGSSIGTTIAKASLVRRGEVVLVPMTGPAADRGGSGRGASGGRTRRRERRDGARAAAEGGRRAAAAPRGRPLRPLRRGHRARQPLARRRRAHAPAARDRPPRAARGVRRDRRARRGRRGVRRVEVERAQPRCSTRSASRRRYATPATRVRLE